MLADRLPGRKAARAFAAWLIERIRKGKDFYRLSKVYDEGDSRFREQSAGIGQKRGEIRPMEVESALFRMKDGEVALIEMEHGFHIIKVVHRQYAGKKPLDRKLQKEIQNRLRGQVFMKESARIFAELKRRAVIETEVVTPYGVEDPHLEVVRIGQPARPREE